ncbi:MAG: hypothetical protein CM1200mP26_09560 [Acidimicrobiales bacterium]|nr:MAG: hypothetical protein CM1200mP26_09560 [Acidimicrobiales bacterium]
MIGPLDHYRTLGVPASASPDELRDAYRGLARRLHPDRVADPAARRSAADRMAKVNEAWRVLGRSGPSGRLCPGPANHRSPPLRPR